jgi:hypothetical protein
MRWLQLTREEAAGVARLDGSFVALFPHGSGHSFASSIEVRQQRDCGQIDL